MKNISANAHHPCRRTRRSHRGQNLVELVLTLPIVVVMLFFIIEMGRVWMTYESAKMAVRDAVYAAATHHNAITGQIELNSRLAGAGLTVRKAAVTQLPNQHAYKGDVTVLYYPFFGSMSIPTLSGPMTLIPNQFEVNYSAVTDIAVY